MANLRNRWCTCFLMILAGLLASAPVLANPALWVARHDGNTVYLFGTVHLVPDDLGWHYPALDQALAQSDALYIEVANANAHSPAMLALVMQYGMDLGQPLSDKLDDNENALLTKAADAAGLPNGAATLQPMKPWLAALTLSVAPLLKAGMDPKHGVDKLLQAHMEKAGKPVHGLETAKQQILFLADLPESVQLKFLRSTLHDFSHAKTEFETLVHAWKRGDTATIAHMETRDMADKAPKLYQRLLVRRNQTWAHTIKNMLQDKTGTIFIAVGAAHLAGPDSVQHQLAKLGIHVQRVSSAGHAAATSGASVKP